MANRGSSNIFGPGIPPTAIALAALIVVPELLLVVADMLPGLDRGAGSDYRRFAVVSFGFWPGAIEQSLRGGIPGLAELQTFLTYSFVHLSLVDAILNAIFVLVAYRILGNSARELRCVLAFLVAAAVGALAYYYFAADDYPLLGATPGALGLLGVTAAACVISGAVGPDRPLGSISKTILILPALIVGFDLLASMIGGARPYWVADLAGLAAGFIAAPLVFDMPYSVLVSRLLKMFR